MFDRLAKLLATFFYVGDIPVAPGSAASAVGVLIYLCLYADTAAYIVLTVIIALIGFAVCGRTERFLKKKDPSVIVIDEVAGVLVAFFLLPVSWPVILVAYFLFRAFDMFKLYPVNKFDEKEGSVGIMMDDLVAGLYTNITMHIAIRLAGIV